MGQLGRLKEKQLLQELGKTVYESFASTGEYPPEDEIRELLESISELQNE